MASVVLGAATAGGARALGIPAGRIEAGHWADLAVIDLEHPSIQGCEAETLAEALVSGADNGVVLGTYVGASWRESSGTHHGSTKSTDVTRKSPIPGKK